MQLDKVTTDEIKDEEVRECPLIGDKHKAGAEEGVVCLQQCSTYDLEPMALAAGQNAEPMLTYPRKAFPINYALEHPEEEVC